MDNSTVIDSTATPMPNVGLGGVMRIPAVRQIMLLFGVAGAVAAGIAVFMWAQTPGYIPIYAGTNSAEAAEISSALSGANIDNKISPTDGSVLVMESQMMEARMRLASQGITPGGSAPSLVDGAFGRTAKVESTLLNQTLEVSLARTISNLGSVRQATVHLAVPERSNFLRNERAATASVVVHTFGGAMLDARQANAIAQLVATAVPGLDQQNVTLVDQHGRMLNSGDSMSGDAMAASQLDYQMKLEEKYRRAVVEILTPLVGFGKVQAQVSADIDFSQREIAREDYDGANAAVVSRQVSETNVGGSTAAAGGVPGALSNQPPEAGGTEAPSEEEQTATRNSSRDSLENFEVPKTLSYEKQPVTIRRLSVAVLVDDTPVAASGEDAAGASLTADDIARLEALAREAVGFSEARGDTVVVTNAPFRNAIELDPVEPPAIWENPMVRDISKQVLGAAVVLAIVFGVVRPMLKNVVASHSEAQQQTANYSSAALGGGGQSAIAAPNYDDKVTAAKNISGHDPARVAQVVKQWVGDNG